MTEKTNTPELRFPEFREGWKEFILNDVSIKKSKKNKNNLYNETFTNSAEYGIVSQKEYFDKEISNKKNLNNYYIVEPNDFVYNPRISNLAPVGPINRNKLNRTGVMSPLYTVFSTKLSIKSFLEYYFKTSKWHRFMKLNGDSGARSDRFTIKQSLFIKMPIFLPSNQEQEKIGDFFSKLDRQIELEEQKLEKLEEQKKGYMQKLFSQELRFKTKDNVYYSEWQLHKLGEIFKYSQGQQISVDKQFSVMNNGMKRFIRIVDITENPEPRFVLYESDAGLVNKGDLFMIRYGRPGIVSIGFEGIIANNLFKLIPKIKISTIYFYYLLSYNYYRINLLTNQSTMPALNFKSLDLLKFKIPSYKEQNKIANFLESIDKLVIKQSDKVKLLKQRKKGLLQKMFV
ncbi:restriction endonuclease subunit S [Staphylococcus hominis]|uniref:restriction endonuclease subunit S n=1 Tax=Staphylococcus hominis TaxID=1290 RepID=UPI0031BB4DC7